MKKLSAPCGIIRIKINDLWSLRADEINSCLRLDSSEPEMHHDAIHFERDPNRHKGKHPYLFVQNT